jgi:rod shape-determining protein MreD
MALEAPGQRILLPVNVGFMMLTVVLALAFDLLPWPALKGVPDMLALVICFWCIREPRKMGIGIPFLLGLVMDAANGVLMGQHALAYSVLAFLAISVSRRVLWFGLLAQSLHVLAILITAQLVTLLVRMLVGGPFPGWNYFLGCIVGAALWPILSVILLAPQRRPASVDETRPI